MIDNKLFPSKVFIANALDPFTNSIKQHPYVVWYCQELDDSTHLSNNIYALRISTSCSNINHAVPIDLTKNVYLNRASFVICDHFQVFSKETPIKVIGQLDKDSFMSVVSERGKVNLIEMNQAVKAYGNICGYERVGEYINKKNYLESGDFNGFHKI